MEVLALANQKGGCGKTTVAINASSALARAGRRVLLVDLDPQAHATLGLGQADFASRSIADALVERASLESVARPIGAGFDLAPGSLRLAEFEDLAARTIGPERMLELALADAAPLYDWVVVDCPARADGVLTANAVRAATLVVLVVETGAFALQGAIRAQRLFSDLARDLDRELAIRVLATLFNPARTMAREILIGMHGRFGADMFDTVIHTADELFDATAFGVPVDELAPESSATRQFEALAAELLEHAELADVGPGLGRRLEPAAPLPPLY